MHVWKKEMCSGQCKGTKNHERFSGLNCAIPELVAAGSTKSALSSWQR
jgi:hypothetical protein